MNFAIPRNNTSEMLLYIWKIINLPFISYKDLLFRLSFELFLDPPEKIKKFIDKCISDKLIVKNEDQILSLSEKLNTQLNNWQEKREIEVKKKMNIASKISSLKNDITKKSTNFSVLINAFVDKGTLNRSVTVSDAAFEVIEYDRSKGIIKSKVKGSKEDSYLIEIDINKKILRHNCHDYETRRANNKKFCKHITKLFLLLKEKNEDQAEFFLSKLAENIDLWDFVS